MSGIKGDSQNPHGEGDLLSKVSLGEGGDRGIEFLSSLNRSPEGRGTHEVCPPVLSTF